MSKDKNMGHSKIANTRCKVTSKTYTLVSIRVTAATVVERVDRLKEAVSSLEGLRISYDDRTGPEIPFADALAIVRSELKFWDNVAGSVFENGA